MQYVKILECTCSVNSVISRGKIWPRDSKCGLLYWSFRYNGVRYIGVLPIKITVILPGPKKYFVITRTSLYRGSTVVKCFHALFIDSIHCATCGPTNDGKWDNASLSCPGQKLNQA